MEFFATDGYILKGLLIGVWRDRMWPDGWTSVTADGKRSAQFEHTLLVTCSFTLDYFWHNIASSCTLHLFRTLSFLVVLNPLQLVDGGLPLVSNDSLKIHVNSMFQ